VPQHGAAVDKRQCELAMLVTRDIEAGIAKMADLASHRRGSEVSGVLFDLVNAAQPDDEPAVDLNAVERSESWSRSIS